MMWKAVLAWLPLVIIAIINGVLRESFLCRVMRPLFAHQVSTLSAMILFAIYMWVLSDVWPIDSSARAWIIGVTWLLLTVLFEFSFGHYVMKHSWSHLLQDYNIVRGRVWLILLIWITVLPYVVFRFRAS